MTARTAVKVFCDVTMITLLDYAPESFRRWILKNEYEGEALEERLKMRIGGGNHRPLSLLRPTLSHLGTSPLPTSPLPSSLSFLSIFPLPYFPLPSSLLWVIGVMGHRGHGS